MILFLSGDPPRSHTHSEARERRRTTTAGHSTVCTRMARLCYCILVTRSSWYLSFIHELAFSTIIHHRTTTAWLQLFCTCWDPGQVFNVCVCVCVWSPDMRHKERSPREGQTREGEQHFPTAVVQSRIVAIGGPLWVRTLSLWWVRPHTLHCSVC